MDEKVYHVRVMAGIGVDVGVDDYFVFVKLDAIKTNVYEVKFMRTVYSISHKMLVGSAPNSENFKNELKFHNEFYDFFDASKYSITEYIQRTITDIYGDDVIVSFEERHDAKSID